MRFKIRTDDGRHMEITLPSTGTSCTWGDLLTALNMKLDETPLEISFGFPLKVMTPPSSQEETLQSLGLKSGDSLFVKTSYTNTENAITQRNMDKPVMMLRVMPDDNSCLFHAVSYVFHDKDRSQNLRSLIASIILSTPETYTEAVLGMSPQKYSQWIQEPSHWGGAIELAIFANYFTTEIASIDVATGRMDLFGEGSNYKQRVYLLYSGIHYDALALTSNLSINDESSDQTIFNTVDDSSLMMAMEVAEMARLEHRYTDVAKFTLRCEDCGVALTGQADAQSHANSTLHTNFIEYEKSP